MNIIKVLAIDTSTAVSSVSICDFDGNETSIISEFNLNAKRTHSQTIMPMLSCALEHSGLSLSQIDYFCTVTGPGSFTGLRIGISAVKGLAYSNSAPCAEVSSLEALAYNFKDMDATVCAVMDARSNQVYNALFETHVNGEISRLCDDRAIPVDELLQEITQKYAGKSIILVGDGAVLCYNRFIQSISNITLAPLSMRYQKATSVALCGIDKIKASKVVSADKLLPNYLRLSQAERELSTKQKHKEDIL